MNTYSDQVKLTTKKDPKLREDVLDICFKHQWSIPQFLRIAARYFITKHSEEKSKK